jgi:hypothetical protein
MGIVDSQIRISLDELNSHQLKRIKANLTFTPNEETVVSCYRERKSLNEIWLPRGAWQYLPASVTLRDKRSFPKFPKLDT